MWPSLSRKSLAGGLVGAVVFTWAAVNAQTAGTISASQTSDAPKPTATKQHSGNIPAGLFWAAVSAVVVLIICMAALVAFIKRRQRARLASADRNVARARRLSQTTAPYANIELTHLTPRDHHHHRHETGWTPGPNDGVQLPTQAPHGYYPHDAAAFVTGQQQHGQQAQGAGPSEAEPQSGTSVPQIVEPRSDTPEPSKVLEDKTRRAHQRQLASLREAQLKKAALRATVRTVEEASPEAGPSEQRNPYALDDAVSRSDDSRFDIVRRGPTVNPAYQTAREQRYRQLIAAGYSHSRAMSVSEASTGESEGPGPLAVVAPTPRRPPTSQPGTHLMPPEAPSLSRRRSIQLPRINVPDRWQPRPTAQAVAGSANEDDGIEEPAILRHPVPPGEAGHRRDSWRFSQLDVGLTETDETATRTSTVISDDPWREEVLENRRRYGNL